MKLKIVGDCLAKVKVDMKGFRKDFKETLDLKEAIQKNFSIIEGAKEITDEMLFKMVHLFLDWGRILDLINSVDKDVMEVRFFSCEFSGKMEVLPSMVSQDGRQFRFKQEVKSGKDIILINSFISSPDYDLASYLKSSYFNYGFERWKPMVEWDDE